MNNLCHPSRKALSSIAMLSILVAMSENRVIGRGGGLPWHLPGDLAHFKATTSGHPVIMGRRTFDSIGRPLPGRTNIIITRNPDYSVDGAIIARSLDEAIAKAEASSRNDEEIFILGGAEIYRQSIPRASRMYITHVHAELEGDTFFPEFDESQWRIVDEDDHRADQRNQYAFTIRRYERITV